MTPTRPAVATMWLRSFTVRDRVIIALVSSLIVVAKFVLRVPLHTPGHSGFFWMALLVIGVGVVGRAGTGTLIGLLTAILATIFLQGRQGILVGPKYFVPGVMIDLVFMMSGGNLSNYVVAAIAGAAANAAKLTVSYALGLVLGIPAGYLALGLGIAATTHVVFGGLGGLIGAFVLKRLDRAGVVEGGLPGDGAAL